MGLIKPLRIYISYLPIKTRLFNLKVLRTVLRKTHGCHEESYSKIGEFPCRNGYPQCGEKASKQLSQYVGGDWARLSQLLESKFDFSSLTDIGPVINTNIAGIWTPRKTIVGTLAM